MSFSILEATRKYFNTCLNQTPAVAGKCSQAIKNCFFEQSVFFALNNKALEQKYYEHYDLSLMQKIKLGAVNGMKTLLIGCIIYKILGLTLARIPVGRPLSKEISLLANLVSPVVEEVLFRGILQNDFKILQFFAKDKTPEHLQDNVAFRWLTSPSARIVMTNLVFAALHLHNAGVSTSDKGSIIQCLRIMLQPTMGILYDTTGDLIAPTVCHVTHNFFGNFVDPYINCT